MRLWYFADQLADSINHLFNSFNNIGHHVSISMRRHGINKCFGFLGCIVLLLWLLTWIMEMSIMYYMQMLQTDNQLVLLW